MRSKLAPAAFAALVLPALALALPGCGLLSGDTTREGITIPPASAGPTADLGLGPGVRPLSFGPGDKGSPRVSPSGERVSFVLDGYVAEKPLYTQDFRRKTASDFGALGTEWLPDENLLILSPEDRSTEATPTPSSLFGARSDDSSPDDPSNLRKLAERVMATAAVPGGGEVVTAVEIPPAAGSPQEPARTRLALLRGLEEPIKVHLRALKGHVTGLSVSPDERQAVLAIRRETEGRGVGRFDIQTYRFSEGQARRMARLPGGMEVRGAPQWTQGGVHFVAGEVDKRDEAAAGGGDPASYALYRIPVGSDAPEPVRGVGEDFVAASISVSPDGGRLAVIGRRNPGSPTNLYVLDLASETLEAATSNENMEIKTNPRDLAWSPDGRYVVLVARGALSGPKVYDAPAKTLSSAFYNLYEVPVEDLPVGGGSEG